MRKPKSEYRAVLRNATRSKRAQQMKADRKKRGETRSEQDRRRWREAMGAS